MFYCITNCLSSRLCAVLRKTHVAAYCSRIFINNMQYPDNGQLACVYIYIYIVYIQGVTGGTDQTSGECSLGQTIPI